MNQQHITNLATYDLKTERFNHTHAGQLNMYLEYYKENEGHARDNAPIGII